MQCQQLHDAVVNLQLKFVDRVFFVQHALGQLFVGVQHRMHRLMDGAFGQAAHPQQPFFQFIQIFLEVAFHEFFLRAFPIRRIFLEPAWPLLLSAAGHSSRAVRSKGALGRGLSKLLRGPDHPKRPVM